MDRIISLLAALVGLIALGGAILVHVNGDTQRAEMAAEIAQLKVSVGLMANSKPTEVATADPVNVPSAEPQPSSEAIVSSEAPVVSLEPSSSSMPPSSAAPSSSEAAASASSQPADRDAEVKALMDRVASLEQQNQQQASELDAARAQLSAPSAPSTDVAAASETPPSSAGPQSAAIAADGPTKDCIPLGTRFMGTAGDSFPICKTKLVLKVMGVSDGLASIVGPGDVAVGATVPYDKGCSIAVFSADTSGYAEMRVTCS